MKIARITPQGETGVRVGIVDEVQGEVLDAAEVARQLKLPLDASRAVDLVRYNTESEGSLAEAVKELSRFQVTRWPIDSVSYHAPVEATAMRDFIAFEEHIGAAFRRWGQEIPPAWYEMPVYYKGNHRSLIGSEEDMYWPQYTEQLDYELELACIIGMEGMNINETHAEKHIGGYCIMNDWSARDIQQKESSVGLGPAKGKDFATSLGPWLVTPDEFDPSTARMIARIDGEVWSDGKYADARWTFPQMIAHLSMDEMVYPGDILGSGTVGGGCGLELGRWLQPGNVVELEITGLGVLRNRVVRVFKRTPPA